MMKKTTTMKKRMMMTTTTTNIRVGNLVQFKDSFPPLGKAVFEVTGDRPTGLILSYKSIKVHDVDPNLLIKVTDESHTIHRRDFIS
jgi:hypothetical protein